MGYSAYFNLDREPFSNAPNDSFYFNSEQHNQALLRLMYSVDSNKGLAVLVGGVGTGKTTLARRMLDNLPIDKYESSLLVMIHSAITPEWILTRISIQLGVKNPEENPLKLLKQLYDRLLEIDKEGRKAVVLIDEAQMLQTRELMEEFRGLLNLEIPGKKLLNIVFFGLPELEDNMKLDEPLAQRVAVKYTLKPLSAKAAESYIHHRVQVAGGTKTPFMPDSLAAVHKFSGGVPRLINTICDNALFETFLRRDEQVSMQIVQSVSEDLGLIEPGAEPEIELPPVVESETAVPTAVNEKAEDELDLDEIELLLDELD